MTAPIRPGLVPPAASPAPRNAQALAAQRAFFQAALDRAQAPSAPVPAPSTIAASKPVSAPSTTRTAPGEETSEPLSRPGRYLDIRV